MKRVVSILVSLSLLFSASFAVSAAQQKIEDKVQYIKLDGLPSTEPEVIEFFSFYCGTCAAYSRTGLINILNKKLPKGIKIKQYHVNFLGGISDKLSRAWVIAQILGVQDKIEPVIFDRIQKTKDLKTDDQIRQIFIDAGVDPKEYDKLQESNNFVVNSMLMQQTKAAEQLKVGFVPSVFINDKYVIRQAGLDADNTDAFIADYARVINYLLKKNN